jgi:hypothetical protein
VDDARIESLRREVLGKLDAERPPAEVSGLEARVARLEAAVAALLGGALPGGDSPRLPSRPGGHPSLQILGPGGAQGDRCLMEPDKPCVQSHACRTFGH